MRFDRNDTRLMRCDWAALCSACATCGMPQGPTTTYGTSRGTSLNGTSVLPRCFAISGHEVRTAIRLNDELADWADGIVRFAPYPGPPDREEAAWYRTGSPWHGTAG